MLSNAYFLAKFRFDTAENEPAKNLQKKIANFSNFADVGIPASPAPPRAPQASPPSRLFTGYAEVNPRATAEWRRLLVPDYVLFEFEVQFLASN